MNKSCLLVPRFASGSGGNVSGKPATGWQSDVTSIWLFTETVTF